MFWLNLFLVGCIYLFLPIVYWQFRNCMRPKKGLILSVTLPPEAVDDPEVQAYRATFRKKLDLLFWLLTVVLVPFAFLPWFSIVLTGSLIWMDAAIVLIFRFYGKASTGLKAIKRRRGWQTAAAAQPAAERKPISSGKPVRPGWFVLPMLLSVLPVLSCFLDSYNESAKTLLTVTALTGLSVTGLSLVFYGLIFRQKPEAMDDDPSLTAALTRIRRHNWTKFWLSASWLTAGYSLAVWLSMNSERGFLIWTMLYTAAIITAALVTEFSARHAQERVTAGRTALVDEDDCWIWGQFYHNPNDTRTFVPDRVGMNMSMNLAKPATKATYVFCAVLLLALPLLGVWTMTEEFAPLNLTVDTQQLVAMHNSTEYRIGLEEVTQVQILEQLPDTWKQSGSSMPNLYKGRFIVEGYGSCILCLDPNAESFLLVQTAADTWLLSGDESVYRQLLAGID